MKVTPRRIFARRSTAVLAATLLAVPALASCGLSGDALDSTGGGACESASPKAGTVTIGSANFPESQLLAQIYSQALQAQGVKTRTTDPIGAREAYLKALDDGSIQLVPEYTGSLLAYLDPDATEKVPDKVYAALLTTIPCSQLALDPSTAQDSNAMVVTKKTADKWHLQTVSDLARHAREVTIAAPPEFRTRDQGLVGLKRDYHLTPKKFLPLSATPAIVAALKNNQAQAANIFSTDPSIKQNNFVVLRDDRHLFGSDNVVPLIAKSAATPTVQVVLNKVSAKLTTDNLGDMVKQVVVDKADPKAVAKHFVAAQGLT